MNTYQVYLISKTTVTVEAQTYEHDTNYIRFKIMDVVVAVFLKDKVCGFYLKKEDTNVANDN